MNSRRGFLGMLAGLAGLFVLPFHATGHEPPREPRLPPKPKWWATYHVQKYVEFDGERIGPIKRMSVEETVVFGGDGKSRTGQRITITLEL